jgi:uncharacterized iron-regulated membrane protein
MNKRLLFQIHKWAALVLALPLLVMAITGVFLAIDHHSPKKPAPSVDEKVSLSQLMTRARAEIPGLILLRGLGRGPGGDTAHLLARKNGTVMIWADAPNAPLQEKDVGSDPWFLNKMIHESFLLSQTGKNLVAICGYGLMLILLTGISYWLGSGFSARTRRLWELRGNHTLKAWHVLGGVVLVLPLLFIATTGAFIESQAWLPRPQLSTHPSPTTCTFAEQLSVVKKLEGEGLNGTVMFCRPDFFYLIVRGPQGIRQLSASGEEVLNVAADDWTKHPMLRKGTLVKIHNLDFLGPLALPLNGFLGASLLFFIVSGVLMWGRKKRKSHARVIAT